MDLEAKRSKREGPCSSHHDKGSLKGQAQLPGIGPRMREKQPQKITSFQDSFPKYIRGSLS